MKTIHDYTVLSGDDMRKESIGYEIACTIAMLGCLATIYLLWVVLQ